MVYSNKTSHQQVSFIKKIIVKFGKLLAKKFPLNRIRVFGLKLCGFELGKDIYIGEELIIASIISEKTCSLKIEDRVAIGPRVTLLLSSDANYSKLMDKINPIKGSIKLESDCWLGAGVIIMPNVTIGSGSIVGAGAVVTKNVPANSIAIGVPARIIKKIH
jgi:acetyltransferase-like isoleucine patch superfamily enzyme